MIKGISDVRRLPRLGKIRLGEKKQSAGGKTYPSKLDHFNFKDVPWVAEVYGNNCKELDIVIPVENQDVFFAQERKAYRLTGLFCKSSDGDTATRVRVGTADGSNPKVAKGTVLDPEGEAFIKEHGEDAAVGEMFELPCLGEACSFSERKLCRPIGRLMFMLPNVKRFGCYEISTTSFNSMVTINSYLEAIRATAGRVSMIPMKLRLVPKQVQVEGKATGIFHLELVYDGTVTDLLAFQHNKALPAPKPATVIPPAADLDKEVPEDLVEAGGAVLEETLGGDVPEEEAGPTPAEVAQKAIDSAKKKGAEKASADPLDDEGGEPAQEAPPAPAAAVKKPFQRPPLKAKEEKKVTAPKFF